MSADFMRGVDVRARQFFASTARCMGWLVVAASIGAVSACGGGGGGGGSPAPQPQPQPQLVLTGQPADQSVVDGDRADFVVQASAAASYQWQSEAPGGAWGSISGATAATYELPAAHAADDGSQYRVVVTSAANAAVVLTSSSATLHVAARQIAPAIMVAPADATVVEGQPASFSITASGTSLTYRWQRAAATGDFSDVDGATAATLATLPTTLADDGSRFRVIVSNALGTQTSGGVRLAVTPAPAAPVFKQTPSDVTVIEGAAATFSVVVVGSPAPVLRWQSGRDGSNWTDVAGQSAASFTLASPALADDGTLFRAVATNASGSVPTPAARLNVAPRPAAPVVAQQPANATVGVGATPSFTVSASGVPAPTYQWQISRDGGSTFTNVNGATSASYSVPATVEGDDGVRLRAVVSNASGTVTSDAAVLAVIPVPHISRQPEAQAWHVGEGTPMFQVVAAGSGLTYQWQTRAGASASFVAVPGATDATYYHSGTTSDATTDVRVQVTNARGGVATSDVAQLVALTWRTVHPAGTADGLTSVRWVDATTAVAVGEGGTIVRSADSGQTWTAVVQKEPAHAFRLAAVDFNSAQGGIAVGQGGLIRRTTDGGVHWVTVVPSTPTSGGYNGRYTGLTSVAFADDHTLVASDGSHAVMHSDDAGLTWSSVDAGVDVGRMVFRHGVGVAFSDTGVARSINGGMQWEAVAGSSVVGTAGATDLAFASDSVIVAAGWQGFARSTDAGLTWTAQTTGFEWTILNAVGFADALHGVALGSDFNRVEAFVTSDGGATWTADPAWQQIWTNVQAISFGPSGVGITAGDGGLLRRSTDAGVSWSDDASRLVKGKQSVSSLVFPTPNLGMMVGFGTMLRTTDSGTNWQPVSTPVSGPTTNWKKIVFLDASRAFAVQYYGGFAQSTDGGATWVDRSSALGLSGDQIQDMTFAPDGLTGFVSAFVGGTSSVGIVMKTVDGGATWSVARQGTTVCDYDFAFGSNVDVVVSDCDGGLEVSHDAGATWARVPPPGFNHFSLQPVFLDSTTVVATGIGLTVRSTDAGRTWTTIENSSDVQPPIRGPATFVSATEGFMIYEDGSVSHTTDGGRTWATLPAARAGGIGATVVRAPHELWGWSGVGLAVTHY